MKRTSRVIVFLGLAAGLLAVAHLGDGRREAARAADRPTAGATSLAPPPWKLGDRWVIETVTERIQAREPQKPTEAPRVRWEFHISKLEPISGHECYRIDVACHAAGRQQPKSTLWCDKDTRFLRQFQTQMAVDGQYRTITECYETAPGQLSPVLPSINALPLAMPAFVSKGAKSVGSFSYKSRPAVSSKDISIVRFAHAISQEVSPPGAKSLAQLPPGLSKDLKDRPLTEVRLADHQQKVVQLWQKDAPWPVYTENGRTRAWLISSKSN
jgi:hypothetical protein